ncbi:MAG: ATP-binding protein [Chloroflexi bacterium]|nr:MAG: ATP-binding protein [Chloroflexota bacterium]
MADLSFIHLQASLARVEVLLRRTVRLAQLAGRTAHDPLRGLHVSDEQAHELVTRPWAWQSQAKLPAQDHAVFAAAMAQVEANLRAIRQHARRCGEVLRLERLRRAFNLSAFERDALLLCLAPLVDLRFEALYGYLHDDLTRKQASPSLILDVLCPPGASRLHYLARLGDQAPLLRFRLLQRASDAQDGHPHPLGQLLCPTAMSLAWLLGDPPEVWPLHPATRWLAPEALPTAEADLLLTEDMKMTLIREAVQPESPPPLVLAYGEDARAGRAVAAWLAHVLDRPLLCADLTQVEPGGQALSALIEWQRDARLSGAVLWVGNADAWAVPDRVTPPAWWAELLAYPDWVVLDSRKEWQPTDEKRRVLRVPCPAPGFEQRRRLWEAYIARAGGSGAEGIDCNALAAAFNMTTEQIARAVAMARDEAAQHLRPLTNASLFAAARAHTSPSLGSLARKVIPRYRWEDLVLPSDSLAVLRELAATVRHRPLVLETWGVGRKLAASAGVTALFAGPPGTGKTMAAEVIAADIGLDLYKIDLSGLVSKYIGETEKNLERIFAEAEHSNAVLFFDEADALFGKRSEVRDAHDRYANIEVSYLLQRMEAHNGLTILATNLRANLDEAFLRRLQFVVDFPFPDEAHRLRIWQTLFPAQVPHADDVDFAWLARRLKLSGGNIRNIIVAAAFLAAAEGGCVTMAHLLHAARRELQKMGRLVNERDWVWTGQVPTKEV